MRRGREEHGGPARDLLVAASANLLVEVRSESTWRYDLGRKRELYLQHGVPELWLVDTVGRKVIVHRSDGVWERHADESLISPQMPGFEAIVGDLLPVGS